jgi:hypothetical protein
MIQNKSNERIKELLAKGISITCIKRVYGYTVEEIVKVGLKSLDWPTDLSKIHNKKRKHRSLKPLTTQIDG